MFKCRKNKFYEEWSDFSRNLYKIMETELNDENGKVIFQSLQHSSIDPNKYHRKAYLRTYFMKFSSHKVEVL